MLRLVQRGAGNVDLGIKLHGAEKPAFEFFVLMDNTFYLVDNRDDLVSAIFEKWHFFSLALILFSKEL